MVKLPVKLSDCPCGPANYERLNRQWWMRALWKRRFYQCQSCGAHLLLHRWR